MTYINQIIQSDCIQGLKQIPDGVVQTCVTSPPYYGLRDYGNDEQIGLEETPEAYVQKMVEVFREVKRVLKDDATLWLNLGDSYSSQGGGQVEQTVRGNTDYVNSGQLGSKGKGTSRKPTYGLKPKDLIGIPWMVAFALRADGWYLRQDIIWNKPNPMPESVTDRCTKSHEYIFLLSKSQKYYYDHEAIKEPQSASSIERQKRSWNGNTDRGYVNGKQNHLNKYFERTKDQQDTDRNKRSVWTINTKPYKEAHFATYPEKLIEPCIKAGSPEGGIVLDPFMGAGTTALVARKLNRNYLGFELNPEYISIAEKRLYTSMGLFA